MLYKRGKTWWIDFTAANGQRIRRSACTTDKTKAQELHDQLKAQTWREVHLGAIPRHTWDEAGLRWIDERNFKASIGKDMTELAWLQPYFSGKYLDELNRTYISEVLEKKRQETSASNANRYLALIRSILNACVVWGWLENSPKLSPYKEPRRRIRWLTPDEAGRLLAELPEHLKEMVIFSLATGLRQANVALLRWNQVDLQRGVAWIHPDQAKARKAIGVPLNETAVGVIRRQIGRHPIYVFTYKNRPVRQTNTKAWKKALDRAGIQDFRWHDLRHTWASWHVQSGTSLSRLQEMGGWESVEMVRRYAHIAPEHLAEDSVKIDTLLKAATDHGTNTSQPTFCDSSNTA